MLDSVIIFNSVSAFNRLMYSQLMRSYGANEYDSPALHDLLNWIKGYATIRFVVQQAAWLLFFWHVYLAYLLHEWICRHRHLAGPLNHLRRNIGIVTVSACTACALSVAVGNRYHLYIQAAILFICFLAQTALYIRVSSCLFRDRQSHGLLNRSQYLLLRKLMVITGLSLLVLVWSLIDLFLELRNPVVGRGFIPVAMLPIIDMVVLGDMFSRSHHGSPKHKFGGHRPVKRLSASDSLDSEAESLAYPSVADLPDDKKAKVKIFTTVYNAQGCASFRGVMGAFDLWIPTNYDLYAIALQQANPQLVQEMKQALSSILGKC